MQAQARSGTAGRLAAGFSGLMALAAYYGSLGLITGFMPVGDQVESRLPFRSPILAGLALAVAVALPMTLAAVLCWRRHPESGAATRLAGAILVVWILVEVMIIRTFSPLQPICAAAGAALVLLGYLDHRGPDLRRTRTGP